MKTKQFSALVLSLIMTAVLIGAFGSGLALAQDPLFGDINGDGVINGKDATLLRQYIQAPNKQTFLNNNSNFSVERAQVCGQDTITGDDLALLRKHLAATDPATVPLGKKYSGYLISLTFDDGPSYNTGATPLILNHLRGWNSRRNVGGITTICGKNGIEPCKPGVGCGTVCGNQSRAQVSFYVLGVQINDVWDSSRWMKEILEDGHSIEAHSMSHFMTYVPSVTQTRTELNNLLSLIATETNGATDFHGNTYSASNPYRPYSYRPPRFEVNADLAGLDREFNMPWIFAGIDVEDWRGHTSQPMANFIMNGTVDSCPSCTGADRLYCSLMHSAWRGGVATGSAHGAIILMHDAGGVRTPTAGALPLFVPQMQEMGYHFVTIEQMYKYMGIEPAWVPAAGTPVNRWAPHRP